MFQMSKPVLSSLQLKLIQGHQAILPQLSKDDFNNGKSVNMRDLKYE
jgi:hypothetical protein